MRVPSAVAYGVLAMALLGVHRFTSIGVDHEPSHMDCAGATCSARQPLELTRTNASPRHLLAPVVVDGRNMLFLVDTGAAATVLSRRSAEDLGLMESTRRILGAVNASFQIQDVLPVERLEVGDVVFGDFEILIVDIGGIRAGLGPDVAGVLGANLLGLQPFEIDFVKPRLWLGRSDAEFTASRKSNELESRVPFDWISGGWFVRARADGRDGFFLVDSGADSTQIGNALAAHSVRITADPQQSYDATGARTEMVRRLELDSLVVGDVVRRGLRVNIAEPSLLGADFFDGLLLRIDPDLEVLVLRAAGESTAGDEHTSLHSPPPASVRPRM